VSLLLLIVPAAIVVALTFFLGKKRIVWWEVLVHLGVAAGLMVGGWYFARWASVQDTEIWNGTVASKPYGTHGCCHSYECNCYESCSGTGQDRTCSRICQTCYEHSRDLYWKAVSSNGETIYNNRCNSPHTSTPARWAAIRIGEPTAVEHRFTNYIKAAPGTFFKRKGLVEEYKRWLPEYPKVSGWRVDRFVFSGLSRPPEHGAWNERLMAINGALGARKQVNIVVVVTDQGPQFYDALASHWLGGKKNDFILVVGAANYPAIDWVRVMTWMDPVGEGEAGGIHESVPRKVEALRQFDGAAVLDILEREIEVGFIRKEMSDFKYLMKGAEPPLWALILLGVLGLAVSGGLGYWFIVNEHKRRAR
jgi:hypothetical protein